MTCWKNRKTGRYHYEFQYLKRRYTGSGFARKRDAQLAKAQHRQKVRSQKQTHQSGGFSQVASIYLDYCERKFVPRTVQNKALVFRKFKKFHGDVKLDHITPAMIHAYLDATCPTNQNYNSHRKELSALFSFVRKHLRVLQYNPLWDLDRMPEDEVEREVPSEEEVLKIVAAVNPEVEKPAHPGYPPHPGQGRRGATVAVG